MGHPSFPGTSGSVAKPNDFYRVVDSIRKVIADEDGLNEGLRSIGVDIDNPRPQVDFGRTSDLIEWLSRKLGDPHFGMHLSQNLGIEAAGKRGYLFLNAPDLEIAIRDFCRFSNTFHGDIAKLSLGIDDDFALFEYERRDTKARGRRQDVEGALSYLWHLMSLYSGNTCKLSLVEFEHEPPTEDASPYRRVFKAPTVFGEQSNRLHFRSDQLRIKSRSSDHDLYLILKEHIQNETDDANSIRTFTQIVQSELTLDALGKGLRAKEIAARLGISETTLYRRLALEGHTFKQLHDEVAKSYASYLIAQKTLAIGKIASKLGYANAGCLTRAFHRWFEMSPRKYRNSLETNSQ